MIRFKLENPVHASLVTSLVISQNIALGHYDYIACPALKYQVDITTKENQCNCAIKRLFLNSVQWGNLKIIKSNEKE